MTMQKYFQMENSCQSFETRSTCHGESLESVARCCIGNNGYQAGVGGKVGNFSKQSSHPPMDTLCSNAPALCHTITTKVRPSTSEA